MPVPILLTGVAGFIGFHVAKRLLDDGHTVVGADCFTPYYDPRLKEARVAQLQHRANFGLERIDLADTGKTRELFARHRPERVIHLAAQPGVRKALSEPMPYVVANVVAFLNVLEGCRHNAAEHLVYASSSSVYGANRKLPFSEHDGANHPISLYGATKKANEAMAHSYAHLFSLAATGLRFFTVYGPWGRPDMAVYAFTRAIAEGRPIEVANSGKIWRDFTFVNDVVEGIIRVLEFRAQPDSSWIPDNPDPATSSAPHRVYNIGNDSPEELNHLISFIEEALGRKAKRIECPLPPGDVLETRADVTDLRRDFGFSPSTPLKEGVRRFVDWYKAYHPG